MVPSTLISSRDPIDTSSQRQERMRLLEVRRDACRNYFNALLSAGEYLMHAELSAANHAKAEEAAKQRWVQAEHELEAYRREYRDWVVRIGMEATDDDEKQKFRELVRKLRESSKESWDREEKESWDREEKESSDREDKESVN